MPEIIRDLEAVEKPKSSETPKSSLLLYEIGPYAGNVVPVIQAYIMRRGEYTGYYDPLTHILLNLGAAGEKAVIKLVANTDADRVTILTSLSRSATKYIQIEPLIPLLLHPMKDENRSIRNAAIGVLTDLGHNAPTSVTEAFAAELDDVKCEKPLHCFQLGAPIVPALNRLLLSKDYANRWFAITELGMMAGHAREALPHLQAMSHSASDPLASDISYAIHADHAQTREMPERSSKLPARHKSSNALLNMSCLDSIAISYEKELIQMQPRHCPEFASFSTTGTFESLSLPRTRSPQSNVRPQPPAGKPPEALAESASAPSTNKSAD